MFYNKYLWVVGIAFIIIGITGITQGRLISGIGFFPVALSAFVAYDKYNPKVSNTKLREGIFMAGMILAFIIWFIGPKIFPGI
jgi:hypothetical protein